MRSVFISWVAIMFLLVIVGPASAQPFISEIRAYQTLDSVQHPPQNSNLFTGSSSFRLWRNIERAFPDHVILNRAFGGSKLDDVLRYADKVILPYNPKHVLVYCGENDLAAGLSAEQVYQQFETLVNIIRTANPSVKISFVSIKPSPSRERIIGEVKKANALIKAFLEQQRHCVYIDIFPQMLNKKGKPRTELFLSDGLHMNALGYDIWAKAIRPHLE